MVLNIDQNSFAFALAGITHAACVFTVCLDQNVWVDVVAIVVGDVQKPQLERAWQLSVVLPLAPGTLKAATAMNASTLRDSKTHGWRVSRTVVQT